MDGIFVTAVQPPKPSRGSNGDSQRIELLGSGPAAGGVSVSVMARTRRRLETGTPEHADGRPPPGRGTRRPGRAEHPDAREGAFPDGERTRSDHLRDRTRHGRPDGEKDAGRARRPAPRGPEEGKTLQRTGATRPQAPREEGADRRGRKRPEPVTTNRNAALAEVRPEQLPVAEQLLRGGLPAVRRAIDEQNARCRSEGHAEISPEPLLAMAEELLPSIALASWKDRALTVRNAGRDAPFREMRSVVAGSSSVTLDDEARGLLAALRESLDARVTALREAWLGRMGTALDGDRVADALRISSHPPEPGARLPGELAVRLATAASAVMSPELAEEHWADLLQAVVDSPVRRTVKPQGLPRQPSEELLKAARRAAGAVPEIARLLGLPIPPPPGPRRPAAVAGRRF